LHPTPPHLGDDLKRDDSRLWQLLDLLVRNDSSQVLHEVVRYLVDVLEADEVALYAGHAPALLIAAYGRQRVAEQHLVDHRMSDALAGRTTVALLPKDHEGAWRVGPQTFIRSGLWVPSTDEKMTPALVRVLRVRPEHFPAGSRRLLAVVVRRLAAVLHRIQQQRYDAARDAERTQLFHVSASIAQELDFELVAERVVVGVTSVTDFADATVEVRNGTKLRRAAAFGSDDLADKVTSPIALWQKALVDEHSVGELSYRVAMRNALPVQADDGADATAGLVTQLQDRDGDVLGFLTLSRPRTGAEPTEQMVQTIELFARQAQIALVNASLYVEAKRQRDIAQALMRVTSAVSRSLETDEVLATCCEAAQSHSVGERAAIYLFDEHGHVTLATSRGRDELPPSAHGPLLVADDPLLTEAVQSPAPVVVDDLSTSARYADSWISRELGLRSVAIYALRTGDDTLGLLVVDSHTKKVDFADHEAALLSQIAAQAAVALRQSSLHAQTREQAARNAQLLELTTAMTTTFEFEAIFERIVSAVRTRMDGHAVSVLRVNTTDIQLLGSITDDRLRCPSPPPRMPMGAQLRDALRLVWEGGTLRLDDVRVYPALSQIARPDTRSVVLAAPLDRTENDVLLTVSTTKAGAFSRGDERFLADLVRVTKLAVRNADLFVEVSEAAKRDPLTGLMNRRVFWETLQRHLADLGPGTLALAVVDADDFKLINDRLGHTVGDAALRHIADRLRRSVRETDEVFRIGGEEFTIVMPDASDNDAHGVMTRVLSSVRQSRADLPPLSVSIGVAIAPDDGKTVDELFREADHALLRSKRNGKNRITLRSDVA
jgi:diguanylate cyclase (GGDEF)-like protein